MRVQPWWRRARRQGALALVAALGCAFVCDVHAGSRRALEEEKLPVVFVPPDFARGYDARSSFTAKSSHHSSWNRPWAPKKTRLRPPSRLASAETAPAPESVQPWTRRERFVQVFQWVVIANVLVSSALTLGWLGPGAAFALDSLFLVAFIAELVLRLRAEGPLHYFGDKTNWLDLTFILAYAADIVLTQFAGCYKLSQLGLVSLAKGLRLTRGSLRLVKLMEHDHGHSNVLIRCAGIAFFVAVTRELRGLDIQSVVGMLGVFAGLLMVKKILGKEASTSVYKAVEPAKSFLVKWATLFFAPALVKLPLVQDNFEGGVLLRLLVLLVVGFLGTLLSTAGIASLFPDKKLDALEPEAPKAATPAPAAATSAPDRRPYKKRLLLGYAGLMFASIFFARLRLMPGVMQNAFMLGSSLLGFVGGMLTPKKVQDFAHPMLLCIVGTWLAASLWGFLSGVNVGFLAVLSAYSDWPGAGGILSFMLGPTVVALGVLLYERRKLLFKELAPMIATSVLTTIISLFYTATLARVLGLPSELAISTLLRCISSPFAGDITGLIGASPTYSIAMIVFTGFMGVILGQAIFKILRLRNPRTRGLSMGAAAHGLGTVALAQSDTDAFPYSALSFVLVGTATTVLFQVPPLRGALLHIVG